MTRTIRSYLTTAIINSRLFTHYCPPTHTCQGSSYLYMLRVDLQSIRSWEAISLTEKMHQQTNSG